MITKFDKKVCKHLMEKYLKVVETLAAADGLTVKPHGGNYTDTAWIAKFEFAVTKTAEGKSREQAEFEQLCHLFYCEKEDYGKELLINHAKYALIGFKPGAAKFNVMVRRLDGTVVLFNDKVLKQIGRMAPWEREDAKITVREIGPGEIPDGVPTTERGAA